MYALLMLALATGPNGWFTVREGAFGDHLVRTTERAGQYSLNQKIEVLDRKGRVVWSHPGRQEWGYHDFYAGPDFDGDGRPEAIIVERDTAATGATLRISVHSLGAVPRNLLVLYTHTWGMLDDREYHIEHIGGKDLFVGQENELSYWIGPRGGAPYPVAFTYANGRLRPATKTYPQVLDEYLKLVHFEEDKGTPPDDYGDFYEAINAAGAEFATRTMRETSKSVLNSMRGVWSPPVVDFLEANIRAFANKPVCHTYAEPYRPIPELPETADLRQGEPTWPKSTEYLRENLKW